MLAFFRQIYTPLRQNIEKVSMKPVPQEIKEGTSCKRSALLLSKWSEVEIAAGKPAAIL